MRKNFARLLKKEMEDNPSVYVLTADLGFKMFDEIKHEYSHSRFKNVGAAEQLLIGAAIGLTYENMIVVCYSITPFLLATPYEILRTYVNHERIPVKLVGGGRDKEYAHDGFSHHATDDMKILSTLENIEVYRPADLQELEQQFKEFLYSPNPAFMSLSKKIF
jgi:transketolase